MSILYGDRCDVIIPGEVFKELTIESEKKLTRINNAVNNEEMKKKNAKEKSNIEPDFTKKIKRLLN